MDDKQKPANSVSSASKSVAIDPALHLHQFLIENNYELSVDSLTENNPYIEGKGFVLTNKPLLVVTVKKREDKA